MQALAGVNGWVEVLTLQPKRANADVQIVFLIFFSRSATISSYCLSCPLLEHEKKKRPQLRTNSITILQHNPQTLWEQKMLTPKDKTLSSYLTSCLQNSAVPTESCWEQVRLPKQEGNRSECSFPVSLQAHIFQLN